ncbi:cell surface protein SprA [Polaribacter sp. SA4-10]|uniref:T9SS outer membrane translocon Sov/SprA n=1 Tax=Polaribacter sp. SA4-10 TaxID=754397 RepID=UPI000B3D204C|nr:cell surface protein SprA [Polaribacter sp. SA4-10]ARV06911.1 cell surface protein SprA [Polaribacter sp. SA4-10]
MNKIFKNIFTFGILTFIVTLSSYAQTNTDKDSTNVKKDTLNLKYNFSKLQKGGLFLDDLAEKTIVFDKELNKYVIVEKIGDYYTRTPIYLSPKEYEQYRLKSDMLQYFKDKVSAESGKTKGAKDAQKNLLPTYYVNSKFFETIFGGNTVEVTPTGSLNLKLGFIYQNTDNPQLSEENRSSFTFDFDQQINASIQAKVGSRLKFTANYDTQSSFDFQNLVKVEFIPPSLSDVKYGEDGIIQGIEAGNISMPIKNSLINGAQSLFGLKTKLQFGNTNITAVFSQQNSESKTVVAEAGASIQEFELKATDYDNDRHFFLSQYFIDNYANSLKRYPLINSQVNITRIEVWITNRNASTEDYRSIVAFADIGESENNVLVNQTGAVQPTSPPSVSGGNLPTNESNNLSALLTANSGIRDISTVDATLLSYMMQQGTDYSILQNARKLDINEFTLNSQLGFISLNRRLNDGEVLAVAYEYTVAGNVNGSTKKSFKIGEFSNDGIQSPDNLAVKLLRSEILQTKRDDGNGGEESFPTWRLMMKNVYALGAYPLSQEGFRFEIQYRDDATGIASNVLQNAQTTGIANQPLIQVLKLDQLDQSQFRNPDGYIDFVEGVTVNSQNGYVIFPEPEPFGNDLVKDNSISGDEGLDPTTTDVSNYVFKELYLNTKINVKNNFQNKDKYFLKGYFKSETSGGIPIGAFNVPRGSVKVTAGGRQLVEGVDYVVDYQLGRVQIIDPGLQSSGTPISVSTENNAVFNQQRKTFMGVDIEHKFSEDFIVGATILNVNERPITPKVNFGAEPIDNTMFGVNINYSTEVPYFTKLANKLPFVDTDVPSNLSVKADMAYLLPGTPSGIDVTGAATSYIDDFEASQIPISLLSPLDWYEASTPKYFPTFNGEQDDLSYNYKRAKLAWYNVDQIFYGAGETPTSIDADELSRAETRQINYRELFPNVQLDITQNSLVRTLDLAYFPEERGSYNFNPDAKIIEGEVTLNNPETNWGGIMRPLTTNNFDQANVEYIQFWIMDPYENYSITNSEGLPAGINPNDQTNQVGDLYINLGNISEDILKDNRKMYENGLPEDGLKVDGNNVNRTTWGDVPRNPSIIYAFNLDDGARENQDVGFDGLNDADEQKLAGIGNYASLADPAADNFQYFRGAELDAINASLIRRYKNFNNTEGNSVTLNQSTESYPTSSSTYPDVEDINRDQTMSTVESYYEYKISMNKTDLVKGNNFIVDEKTTTVTLENGSSQQTKWYQFRVPVRSGTPINGISDFNSIRFVRMFLTNFKMPVIIRFGELDLVRGDWRRYVKTLDEDVAPAINLTQTELNDFEVGVVSIEQNEGSYIQPPGIERERLQGSTTVQLQNEQSVTLKVNNLQANSIRAIYKNISIDLRRFKNLKMFMHLQSNSGSNIDAEGLHAVIRLGTDLDDNYYQIDLPLTVSPAGTSQLDIWPEANNLDAFLETFGKIKLERNALGTTIAPINELFTSTEQDPNSTYTISVKGNPTLAQLKTIMLGVKNTTNSTKNGEVWFNELRSSGFDNDGGWAAVVNADANFADVANVSLSGSMSTVGFGNVEDRVSQRSLDETKQYDVATSINLGKVFTPERWGIQLPMSYSVGEKFIDPKFDPQYQDVKLADAIAQNPNSEFSRDYTKRTSISFNNVKKNRNPNSTKKPKFYDVENMSVSYAHNKEFHRDYNIKKYINENVTASASYNFNFKSKSIEPFKNSEKLKNKYWKLIKDINFNPIPKTVALNSRINRSYNEQQSRNLVAGLSVQPELKQRRFLFDWDYTIGFDLTKSLQLNFNATNSYIYDAFESDEELEVFDDFFNTGRPNHYHQKLNATYKLPIDKIPFLSFIKADYGYTADFDWQTSSQDQEIVSQIGNVIQNANTHNLNTTINFEKFYKGLGFEKLLLTKSQRKKAKGLKGNGLPTAPRRINKNKKLSLGKKILKGTYDVITSVKTGKISYSENNGQLLPGYTEDIGFLGGAPTSFAFGSQVDIRNKALINGWLINPRDPINSEYYNKTYSKTHYNKLDYSFTLKPFKDFNIEVRGNKIQTRDLSQQLDVIENGEEFGEIDTAISAFETGNFSTSHSMISTAFSDGDALFQQMRDYRSILSNRLSIENGVPAAGFGENSQQVLLPAFIAAYSGNNPDKVSTGLFRDVPIPNWSLRYNGLMKFNFFKKNFSNFVVSHGYNSSYTISNFTNNLQHNSLNPYAETNTTSGNYEPELLVSAVTLVDEFSPLVKVDMKMKNSFSFRGEIKRDRTLTMNFNNSTLTDIKGTEYIFGLGYVFKDVKFDTRFTGKKQTLKGDVNLRADVSLRDNLTQIRSVDEDNNQISGGQKLFSIKFTADYRLNSNLTASFYYNHQTSKYAISTTFPRQAINGGFNIIYNLGGN